MVVNIKTKRFSLFRIIWDCLPALKQIGGVKFTVIMKILMKARLVFLSIGTLQYICQVEHLPQPSKCLINK
jgi:hypothetical protein